MFTIGYQSGAIDPSFCVDTAWELVKRRMGLYIGCSIVMLLILSFSGLIPFANVILTGPMIGGFTFIVLKDLRGEPVEFSMLFYGFKKFLKLMIVGVVQAIPAIFYQVVQLAIGVRDLLHSTDGADPNFFQAGPAASDLGTELTVAFVLIMIGYFIFTIIWNLVLLFAIPLIVEHDLPVLETIKLSFAAVFSNLGGMIVLAILGALVGLLGMIAFCIGLLVAIPVIWASDVIAYKQVFALPGETLFSNPSGNMLNLDSD